MEHCSSYLFSYFRTRLLILALFRNTRSLQYFNKAVSKARGTPSAPSIIFYKAIPVLEWLVRLDIHKFKFQNGNPATLFGRKSRRFG